jgi:hypothetical protein
VAQSPPPITLPARAQATAMPLCLKNDRRRALVTNSEQPLLLLVGVVAAHGFVFNGSPKPTLCS